MATSHTTDRLDTSDATRTTSTIVTIAATRTTVTIHKTAGIDATDTVGASQTIDTIRTIRTIVTSLTTRTIDITVFIRIFHFIAPGGRIGKGVLAGKILIIVLTDEILTIGIFHHGRKTRIFHQTG